MGAKSKPPIKQKYIETPEKMREYFNQYKAEVKSNPILVHDFVGKDGESVYRQKERPLTMEGFENWLWEHDIITDAGDYFENKDGRYAAYAVICRAIKKAIRHDQIVGGLANIYNPSITARINGLTEKVDNTIANPDGSPIKLTMNLSQ